METFKNALVRTGPVFQGVHRRANLNLLAEVGIELCISSVKSH